MKSKKETLEIPESDVFEGTPHPRGASFLFGHQEREKEFLETYRRGHFPHAWIIGGEEGIGKATLAWRLVLFLLCFPDPQDPQLAERQDLSVDLSNPLRSLILSLSHPDVVLLRRIWNEKTKKAYTEIRVEEVRRMIHMFHQTPNQQNWRIGVIDCAEDLNRSSANALLKIIEEPPPRSVFLIISHKPSQILPTLRSRCRLMLLQPLTPLSLRQVIKTLGTPWSDYEEAAQEQAIAQGRGSVRETLRLLSGTSLIWRKKLLSLLETLPSIDWREVHLLLDILEKEDLITGFEIMMSLVYDWLDSCVHRSVEQPTSNLLAYAEMWDVCSSIARDAKSLNLDRKSLILSLFDSFCSIARLSQREPI